MNEHTLNDAVVSYRSAEERAKRYFELLDGQLQTQHYATLLTQDIGHWKQQRRRLLASVLRRTKKQSSMQVEQGITYIFMRDLGKPVHKPEMKAQLKRTVHRLQTNVTYSRLLANRSELDVFSTARLYRWAEQYEIESTMIWLMNKLNQVVSHLPAQLDRDQTQRKLLKIIMGVLMHAMEEMGEQLTAEERAVRLDQAIRLGYSYGLTYPFIDDLLDAKLLTSDETAQYTEFIRTTLVTHNVPQFQQWDGPHAELMQFIYGELAEAYTYMKSCQRAETIETFFEQSYILFQAQEVDRVKQLSYAHYTNAEIYVPIILKSAASRLLARSAVGADHDADFNDLTFYYGIYNQLSDDLADWLADREAGNVTPYTYYMKYHEQRPDLINPFELYWVVVANLIHHVYESDGETCRLILERAFQGLKRYEQRLGTAKYKEVMGRLRFGNSQLYRLVLRVAHKTPRVDFLDKWLRDQLLQTLNVQRQERDQFVHTVRTIRQMLNEHLTFAPEADGFITQQSIVEAANYSLAGDGKRLRPIITWVMGVQQYGLKEEAMMPLLKALEFMHTASLIFDDLPAQDHAQARRGRPTVHEVYNVALAELTGIFLTQKAIEEQTLLQGFDAKTVLQLIQHTAQITMNMCKGQALDLASKGTALTLEQLNELSYYKTSLAFEASLVSPAILAHAQPSEIEALQTFAYHAGIAFQIKDDLLDVEGDPALLGKAVGKDEANASATFVSILGLEGARKQLWHHYCAAIEALHDVPRNTNFLKELMNYMLHRNE